jgi:membrane-associated phospholipid phosphatase
MKTRNRVAVLGLALAAMLSFALPAQAATTYPSDSAKPDVVALLKDYENYWKPSMSFDSSDTSTFGVGTVENTQVLKHNDTTTQAINNAAAAGSDGTTPTAQQKRALIDSDYKMDETLPDALGPILGKYFSEGLADGSLPKTSALLITPSSSLVSDYLSTGTAKITFNHPRPFVDRTAGGYVAAGLAKTVSIDKVPVWTDAAGTTHDAGYDGFLTSGSFPSGHTTYAMSGAVGLATLLPRLAPEILARGSEAGNNRIVLGVHYPLDIMGGRIDGEAANVARWSDAAFRTDKLLPAQSELENYLTARCKADGRGDTLAACIAATGANDAGGYANSFTDAVSTTAVTNRATAIKAYTARLTYGFSQTGAAGQKAVVPAGASNLLLTTFPSLTDAQRTAVLADTEIDSGYPLDASSQGYQRLNLAAAMSAKVTIAADGSVKSVEPGQKVASVVKLTASSTAGAAGTASAAGAAGAAQKVTTGKTNTNADNTGNTADTAKTSKSAKPAQSAQAKKASVKAGTSASGPLAQTGTNELPFALTLVALMLAGAGALVARRVVEQRKGRVAGVSGGAGAGVRTAGAWSRPGAGEQYDFYESYVDSASDDGSDGGTGDIDAIDGVDPDDDDPDASDTGGYLEY